MPDELARDTFWDGEFPMSSSLIHWRHQEKHAPACGATGEYIYTQVDFHGTVSARDQDINPTGVPMTVNCKRCIAVHDAWLEREMAKLRSVLI